MGKITSITTQKNKSRVNLFLDGSFFCGLMAETLIANHLKVGQEVDELELADIITESEIKKAQNYAFGLVAKKPYTKFELISKLKARGYDGQIIDAVLKKLDEYGFVDDLAYAKAFVTSGGNNSKRALEQKLMRKGVKKAEIEIAVNDLKKGDEMGKIEAISAKYMKNKAKTRENFERLYRYLAGKGFDFDAISAVVNKLKEGIDDESWD